MATNVGELSDLMEIYAGQAGVSRDKIPRKMLRKIINFKLQEFARRSGVASSKISMTSVASQQEYELSPDVMHVTDVHYDGSRSYKIDFEDVIILQDNLS